MYEYMNKLWWRDSKKSTYSRS